MVWLESPRPVATLAGVRTRFVALGVAAIAALVPATQSLAEPDTTAPPPVVDVKVTITDSRFSVSPNRARRGSLARFILVNVGRKPHAFKLGHERRGTGSQTGFTTAVPAGKQKVNILFLDYRGTLAYSPALPSDRAKRGMTGQFTIY
jgi:hypothetical protein